MSWPISSPRFCRSWSSPLGPLWDCLPWLSCSVVTVRFLRRCRCCGSSAQVSCDAIVVLSGGRHPAPGPAQISEWHDPDRFLAGVALFQSGRASRLLFTRGQNPFHPGLPPEGELYRAEAVDLGVPATSIGLTDRVTNTAQEAKAIRRLLPQDQPRVLLVTSAFHMRRAQVMFERQGLTVLPYPVDFQARAAWAGSIWRDPLQWLPNSRSLNDSSRALRELMGRLAYRSW